MTFDTAAPTILPLNVAPTPIIFLVFISLKVDAVPVIILSVDATPVNPVPSPKKLVALITPTISNFSVGDVELTPTLLSVPTVKVAGLLNFDKLRALVIAQLLSSYLGHKKRPPSLPTGDLEVWVEDQMI